MLRLLCVPLLQATGSRLGEDVPISKRCQQGGNDALLDRLCRDAILEAPSCAVTLAREAGVIAIRAPAPVGRGTDEPAVAKTASKLAREQVLGWIPPSQRVALPTLVEYETRHVEEFSVDNRFVLRREALALKPHSLNPIFLERLVDSGIAARCGVRS